jgi:SOS-response transcriptional repressor LexA
VVFYTRHMSSTTDRRAGLLLRWLRHRASIEQEELARRLGVSQPTVSRWEAGRLRPAATQLSRLLEQLAPTAEAAGWDEVGAALQAWQRAGDDPSPQLQSQLQQALARLAAGRELYYDAEIPCYADIAAGLGEMQEQRRLPRCLLPVPRQLFEADPGCYALRVVGDSMAPAILSGDIVVVSPAAPLSDGCIVAAYVEPDGDVVKQYHGGNGHPPRLVPLNPAYPVIELAGETAREARIWGRVVMQQREL